MNVYSYHPETGEYLGITTADESPLEPGVYLDPDSTTRVQPGIPNPGFAMVWFNGAWTQVADHRGETWWNEEGQPVVIAELGDPAANGLSAQAPPAPETVPPFVTRRQLLLGLTGMGIITGEEALAAAKTGEVPAAIDAFFSTLPSADALAARVTWASMSVAERDHPLVAALAALNNLSSEDIDNAFRAWAQL